MPDTNPFGTLDRLTVAGRTLAYHRLAAMDAVRGTPVTELPYVVRILLESALRHQGEPGYRPEHARALACWRPDAPADWEFPYLPARVLFQDLTGVACVVDLASLRSAMVRAGGDPGAVEPRVPVDLVIDHSVQIDRAGCPEALAENMRIEFTRNRERYEFLRWGQHTFKKLRIVPPGVGICHQVNLEFLARGVCVETAPDGTETAFPDTLVGTDSHTTMVNGLGVLGWGVGGIEAEAAMLGQPIAMLAPVVTGVRLTGRLRPGVTATDLALAVTKLLRSHNVVGQFVEYFGPGCAELTLADRSVVANMAPEYGATTGFFPMDAQSLAYLRMTGRPEPDCALVEAVLRAQSLLAEPGAPEPRYTSVVELDLSTVEPLVAGPRRPHEGQPLSALKQNFLTALPKPPAEGGFSVPADRLADTVTLPDGATLRHGSLVVASITSCTNTSNPSLLLAAGLLARKAVERGLAVPSHVKTSLVPGSRVVAAYLASTGLLESLERLGFGIAAFGCGTCIGNSGPIRPDIADAIRTRDLTAAAVLSGNRNFEGRIHPCCKANFLCSPPLVVAYALAGRVDLDLENDPLGTAPDGTPVYLRDLWPTPAELAPLLARANDPALYAAAYRDVNAWSPDWASIPEETAPVFPWRPASTYIREAPFLDLPPASPDLEGARALAVFGDFITTDHISPAGTIAPGSPAARYLLEHGVAPADFNSYGSRRGNHEVMVRGTFANIRLKNRMVSREGGWTRHQPDGAEMAIYDAAEAYRASGTPVLVLAGKMYGAGSSRDWAAKGPLLLGVRVVIAESFERIHRSNLVEMGILPLEFPEGQSAATLGLNGTETYTIHCRGEFAPHSLHDITALKPDGTSIRFTARNRVDTPAELAYMLSGGILPHVLHRLLAP
jgi:aconitate hydratase